MIITCDTKCDMGYIYLIYPKHTLDTSSLDKTINIIENNFNLENLICNIYVEPKTYIHALENDDFSEEFYNDRDNDDYITGIELSLSKSKLVELNKNAFKIYKINWNNTITHVVTFDTIESITSGNIKCFKMNNNNDTYLLVEIENKHKTCFLKALITTRIDIYDLEYLKSNVLVYF